MPELPEVETTRRLLEPLIVGRRIDAVEVGRERMLRRQERLQDFVARLTGRTIEGTDRIGKHLLIALDGDLTWVIHLGMSGRISVAATSTDRPMHTNVVALMDDRSELRFTDPRTFGYTVVLTPAEIAAATFAKHGPDALKAMPTASELQRLLSRRSAPIKAILLDQTVVSGVGNIYADEALHRARISPHRMGRDLSPVETRRLRKAIGDTLERGLAAGGTTLDDQAYLLPDGRAGDYAAELRAYGREGESCPRCRAPIRRDVIRARSTFWCAGCQV